MEIWSLAATCFFMLHDPSFVHSRSLLQRGAPFLLPPVCGSLEQGKHAFLPFLMPSSALQYLSRAHVYGTELEKYPSLKQFPRRGMLILHNFMWHHTYVYFPSRQLHFYAGL